MKKIILCCLISSVVGAGLALFFNPRLSAPQLVAQQAQNRPAPQTPIGAPGPVTQPVGSWPIAPGGDDLTPEERVYVSVYEQVNRSVVHINTKGAAGEVPFFSEPPSEGEGSGSVLDKAGHVLTNYHVIEGAREMTVTLFDGKTYAAHLIGQDPTEDVAVIKIDAPADSLFPVVFGDSTRLRVGQRVFAIGNPFGLERTLTTGIISSLDRSIPSRNNRTIKSIIQIDAAINPGNSGGPLLDSHSRLIGMNTAIASRTGQSAGVGFAIPASILARSVPQLIAHGRVVRAEVGIAKVYQTERGLLIAALTPGGPAENAGLKGPRVVRERRQRGQFIYEYQALDRSAADLIVAVDGKKVSTADSFLTLIESKQPGQEVVLTIIRDGRETPVKVRLGSSDGG